MPPGPPSRVRALALTFNLASSQPLSCAPAAHQATRSSAARLLAALLAADDSVTSALDLDEVLGAVRGAALMDADPQLRALCEHVRDTLEGGSGKAAEVTASDSYN